MTQPVICDKDTSLLDIIVHMQSLAIVAPSRRSASDTLECVPLAFERLISSWRCTPAFVHGRYLDVLASNALMQALSLVFSPGVNLLRSSPVKRFVSHLCMAIRKDGSTRLSPNALTQGRSPEH
jgi:hypothetical protein